MRGRAAPGNSATYVKVASTRLPVLDGTTVRVEIWTSSVDAPALAPDEIVVLEHRPTVAPDSVPLVRLHSACLTGDVLGSLRCDCGVQLADSLQRITSAEWGVLVYLVGQEGRGIGLTAKLRAYALQDLGLDTIQANLKLGHRADERDYFGAATVLREHGVTRLRMLTNNPLKVETLRRAGLEVVDVEPLETPVNPFNGLYLAAKRRWFAECLEGMREDTDATAGSH